MVDDVRCSGDRPATFDARGHMRQHPIEITLRSGTTGAFLAMLVVFLILAHFGVVWLDRTFRNGFTHWLLPLFNLDVEGNIPSVFATGLWLINAALFFLIWKAQRFHSRRPWFWLFLSGLFCFLALDELSSIHEELVPSLRSALGASGLFSFAWIIPYGFGVMLLAMLFIPVARKMDPRVLFWYGAAAMIFVAGSIGLEMCEGKYLENHPRDMSYFYLMTAEESLEMAGLAMLAYASLLQLEIGGGGLLIRLPGASRDPLPPNRPDAGEGAARDAPVG